MGEDSRLDNSPWSAPGPWARRGAEFTGNSPHAAEPPKPNSDACISQGELLAACWLGLRCFLDLAGIFWVTLVSVLLSAWLSWRPSLSLRQRTIAVKGYMHGRTAQCGFGKHDDGRWLLRWPRRAANRNLPKPKAHRFSQCHLYATAAAVTVTTLCCALYQLLCFTQQIPGVLCQWYWVPPEPTGRRDKRSTRGIGMLRNLGIQARLLHFLLLLYMARADQGESPPPQQLPHLAVALAMIVLLALMIRAKRQSATWRFDRDDPVEVNTGANCWAPARVDARCTFRQDISGAKRYRVTYLGDANGPPRIPEEDMRMRCGDEMYGPSDDETESHQDEASASLQEAQTLAARSQGVMELEAGADVDSAHSCQDDLHCDEAPTHLYTDSDSIWSACTIHARYTRGTVVKTQNGLTLLVKHHKVIIWDSSLQGCPSHLHHGNRLDPCPRNGVAGNTSAIRQEDASDILQRLGGLRKWEGRTSSFLVCAGALSLHLNVPKQEAQRFAAAAGPHNIKGLIDMSKTYGEEAARRLAANYTRECDDAVSISVVDGFSIAAHNGVSDAVAVLCLSAASAEGSSAGCGADADIDAGTPLNTVASPLTQLSKGDHTQGLCDGWQQLQGRYASVVLSEESKASLLSLCLSSLERVCGQHYSVITSAQAAQALAMCDGFRALVKLSQWAPQYRGHASDAFWSVLAELANAGPTEVEERLGLPAVAA